MSDKPHCAITGQPIDGLGVWYGDQLVSRETWARIEAYADQVNARAARLAERAARTQQEAASDLNRARQMASHIPFGQPILVGHHSEGRDRRYRARIDRTYRRGFEKLEKARRLAERADAAAATTAIQTEDPAALLKLREKLAAREAAQQTMKQENDAVRKAVKAAPDDKTAQVNALVGLLPGLTEARAFQLLTPDFLGRRGHPDYRLKNNGAEIRRLKHRIQSQEAREKQLAAQDSAAPLVEQRGQVTVERDVAANRLRLRFPGKPSAAIRTELKGRGFRWAPSEGAWQAYLTARAEWAADFIVNAYHEEVGHER